MSNSGLVASPSQARELYLARLRTFVREPGILFWVFGFPLLLALCLGLAFRHRGPEKWLVAVEAGPDAESTRAALAASASIEPSISTAIDAGRRLDHGEVVLVVRPGVAPSLSFDATRPGATAAASAVRDALERAAGRKDVLAVAVVPVTAPGRRYIDFLIPGLLGMGLLGGGLWGVGYEIVGMRVKRLLKRFTATPMSRPLFLGSFVVHRLAIAVVETAFLLTFGYVLFDVEVHGSIVGVFATALLGGVAFAGLGLAIASRARNLETANGLMNAATLPMWMLSGVFFATSNFPEWMRPLIDALPLTALNDALRAQMGDGASLFACAGPLGILAAWGVVSYAVALRWFRWQ